MLSNRSMPESCVIPVLPYPEPGQAIDWLCRAFGFTVRLRIGDHRAQLNAGNGAIVIAQARPPHDLAAVMVRVEDARQHCATALKHGALLLSALEDYPYGERQYTVEDLVGHRWTFSQTISDVNPQVWGGIAPDL